MYDRKNKQLTSFQNCCGLAKERVTRPFHN